MENTSFAYFVERPRRIEDLIVPHLLEKERPYEIVKLVTLTKIDYENFITDMLADRQFIEDTSGLCSCGQSLKCLLVQQFGRKDGTLICLGIADMLVGRHIMKANYYLLAITLTKLNLIA